MDKQREQFEKWFLAREEFKLYGAEYSLAFAAWQAAPKVEQAVYDARDAIAAAEASQAQQPADGVLVKALEKLARLGAGERYGNSDGNVIAQQALAAYFAGRDKQEGAK